MRSHVRIIVLFVVSACWFAANPAPAPADPSKGRTGGALTIGPGGTQNFNWQINDARGVPGPSGTTGTPVSGWSLLTAKKIFNPITGLFSTGNLTWTATSVPGSQFSFAMFTLLNPSPVGTDNFGQMDNFHTRSSAPPGPDDGNQTFAWPVMTFEGTYSGPLDSATLTADTLFDTSQFQNLHPGTFSMRLGGSISGPGEIDLVYTPVPEPGTLGLVVTGMLGVWMKRRRRSGISGR